MSKWFRCKPNKGLKHTNQELTLKHGLIHRMSPNYSRSIACSLVWVKLSSHTVTMIHNQPIARCLYHYNAAQYSTMLYHTDECGYYYYLVRLLLSLTVINCERVQIALNKCKESAWLRSITNNNHEYSAISVIRRGHWGESAPSYTLYALTKLCQNSSLPHLLI